MTDSVLASKATVLSPADVDRLPSEPLAGAAGVRHRVVWRNDTSMAGVLEVDPGAHLGAHVHRANHHHIWIVDGYATILGAHLGPGAYVHIPAGVEHDIEASAREGCTLFYLYARPASKGG